MDIIVNPNIFRYVTRLLDRTEPMQALTDYVPEKPLCTVGSPISQPFERVIPESEGEPSYVISDFLYETLVLNKLKIHGITIIKNGKIICDLDTEGHSGEMRHVCHSLSKSVTAMAIGMLIDEGKLSLDDKVTKLLERRVSPLTSLGYRSLTVRHLLTMTSGAGFSEIGTVVEKSWLKAYFESGVTFAPGKRFNYNSLNSYVLSWIVREVSGRSLTEYLRPRLFEPLGITDFYWEKSPERVENGGWGLYLRREDVAKLAQLYLDLGVWKGRRIISEDWVKRSTTPWIKTPSDLGDFGYGYHIWANRQKGWFLFNGMFGQDALVLKKQRIVIVTNGGIEQLFQQSEYYDIVDKYFGGQSPPSTYGIPLKKLKKQLSSRIESSVKAPLFPTRLPKEIKKSLGIMYCAPKTDGRPFKGAQSIGNPRGCGLMPIAEQLMRNTYASGIRSVCLRREDGILYLDIDEYDSDKILPIVIGKTVPTVVKFGSTQYRATVTSRLSRDEDGYTVLIVSVEFPEIASTRNIRIYFKDDSITVKMSEMPGLGLVRLFADSAENVLRKSRTVTEMVSKLDADLVFLKLEKRFEPTFTLLKDN